MKVIPVISMVFLAVTTVPAFAQFEPTRRVELVVHTATGAGSDMFARALQTMLEEEGLLPHGSEVVNRPNPSGAAAMGYLAQNAGDPHVVMLFTSTFALERVINPTAPISWEDLTPIANLTIEPSIALVRPDSPYQTFDDFIEDAQARPGELVQVGGSFGLVTLRKLILEQATGASWRYVAFPSGGERVSNLLGGHADLLYMETQEGTPFIRSGQMRPIALYAPERMEAFPDLPTFNELGYDMGNLPQMRGILAAPGISEDAIEFWTETFRTLVETETWEDYMAQSYTQTNFLPGDELDALLRDFMTEVSAVIEEHDISISN